MSGPKCGYMRIIPAPAVNAARAAEIRRLLTASASAVTAAAQQLEALKRPLPEHSMDRSFDNSDNILLTWIRAAEAELSRRERLCTHLREAVARAVAEEEARRQAEALAVELARQARDFVTAREARAAVALVAEIAAREARAARIAEVLAGIDPRVAQETKVELEKSALACLAAEGADSAELLVTDLRVRVGRVNRTAKDAARRTAELREADTAEARRMLLGLAEVSRPASGALADALAAVVAEQAPFTPDLRAKAAEALSAGRRDFAMAALTESLQELGYDVGEAFETTLATQGATFQREEWGDYHAAIRLDAPEEQLSLRIVRACDTGEPATSAQVAADAAMEERWCAEVPQLLNLLREKGVDVDLHKKIEPGAIPVQVVAPPRRTEKRSARQSSKGNAAMRALPLKR